MDNEEKKRLKLKDWAEEDRPREKLLSKGIHSLSNVELLAILISTGNRNETAVELSRRILEEAANNLQQLGKYSVHDFTKIDGIGPAKAITIIAAMELGRRRNLAEAQHKKVITCSSDVFNYFHPLIADLHHEEFWILFLKRSNEIIDHFKVSQGGISGTVIDVKIILKKVIEQLCTSVVICHNHPSGNTNPSDADKSITQKINSGLQAIDVKLLDHIIVSDKGYFSFGDEGLL